MKILLSHNFYKLPGGEDQVYYDECWLLENQGQTVVRYEKHNSEIDSISRVQAAKKTIYNPDVDLQLSKLIAQEQPDLVHFHNTFPLIGLAGYQAAARAGVPIIQTLHNFRLLCPSSSFLRKGRVCQLCANRSFAWPAIRHACYQHNSLASGVVAIDNYWNLRNKIKHTSQFIALTEHARNIFVSSGFPQQKLALKPNFVRLDPGEQTTVGPEVLYVGRLSEEKGINVLLEAWMQHAAPYPLKIVGDGPLGHQVAAASQKNPFIQWLGQLSHEDTIAEIKKANVLVMPSICFETFGRTTIEAFATGLPVVASNLGAMAEIVLDGVTGLRFEPGNPLDCLEKIRMIAENSQLRQQLARAARQEYLNRYSADSNYQILLQIYESAIAGSEKSAKGLN